MVEINKIWKNVSNAVIKHAYERPSFDVYDKNFVWKTAL